MTLVEHLEELRKRIIYCVYAVVVFSVLGYILSDFIFNLIRAPISPYLQGQGLVFTSPMEKFGAYIKISVLFGFSLALPITLFQIWQFVAPGLYKNEKKYLGLFIGAGTILFLTGGLFAYFFAMPPAFEMLLGFGSSVDKPMITIDAYMSFFLGFLFAFGMAFELPLVLVLLGLIGVVQVSFLTRNRRFAIMLLAVASAILTPSADAFSMIILLVPLVALYELSIITLKVLRPSSP